MTYQLGIDVDAVRAIDTHVHVEVGDDGHCALPQPVLDAATAYFKAPPSGRSGRDRRPLPRPGPGRGRVHRRRRHQPGPPGQQQRGDRRRAPRGTTTC